MTDRISRRSQRVPDAAACVAQSEASRTLSTPLVHAGARRSLRYARLLTDGIDPARTPHQMKTLMTTTTELTRRTP